MLLLLGPDILVQLACGVATARLEAAGRDRDAVAPSSPISSVRRARRNPLDDEVPITGERIGSHDRTAPADQRAGVVGDRRHYSTPTRERHLDALMAACEPAPGGLLLWHGEPGTGKTYALRALAREWRGWCDTHFITDADAFLGGQTGYLLSALLRSNRNILLWRLISKLWEKAAKSRTSPTRQRCPGRALPEDVIPSAEHGAFRVVGQDALSENLPKRPFQEPRADRQALQDLALLQPIQRASKLPLRRAAESAEPGLHPSGFEGKLAPRRP